MRRFLLVFVLVTAMVAAALPAGATPPSDVEIVVVNDLSGADPFPFVASGPAVDDGIVCESGEVTDEFFKASGFQSNRGVNFQILKEFTCDDGSGDFLVKLQVRLLFDGSPATFNWNVKDGTGAYEDLHGGGSGIGLQDFPFVTDIYQGGLHID